jgi:hypothetical protein
MSWLRHSRNWINVGLKSFFGGFDSRYMLDIKDKGDYSIGFFVESAVYCSELKPHLSLNGYPKLINYFSISTDNPFMDL